MENKQLPEEWQIKKLRDICEIEKNQGIYNNLPYVGMENIESNTAKFIGSYQPQTVKSSTFRFSSNHILYGRLRPYLNKLLAPNFEGHCSTELFPIKPIIDGDRGTNYPKKYDFYDEGYCLFLNTKNVRPDGFNFDTKMFISEEKDKLLRKGKLKRRDVILTTRGTIGNIAIYDESVEFEHIRINSGMLIFRPNENIIKSEYLFEILRSSIMKSQIKKFTSGAAQPQLPINTLINFTLPVPKNIEEQSRIVSNLRELYTEIQRLENIYRQKIAALKELKQSILQKAFTGELTADKGEPAKRMFGKS